MNFLAFSEKFFGQFRFFGVHPIVRVKNKNPGSIKDVSRDRFYVVFVIGLLVMYWSGIIMSFFTERKGNDQISIISNIIQLILNAVAFTTILINTLLKFRSFDEIVQGFEVIDENFKAIERTIRYKHSLIISRTLLITYGIYMIVSISFECYVTVVRYKMNPFWYWTITTLPSIVYSMFLLQAMFIITWISTRCHLINSILRLDGRARYLRSLPAIMTIKGIKGNVQKSVDLITKIYTIMSDICQLSRTVDGFMGPSFLATITAIFSVTSIQVYYIYVTAITMSDDMESAGFSVWSLLVSLNIVLMNVFLVIGLTTICERVNAETMQILQNFSELQINKEVPAELSIWLHPMISHMKFTAFGFFSIDYTMLCGFMTAIITYLVIFIQFYQLDPVHGDKQVIRNNQPGLLVKNHL